MNCKRVEERLEAWIDGDLAPAEARELEAHLERHAPCAQRASLARAVRAGLRALPERDAPAALVARIKVAAHGGGGRIVHGPWGRLRRPLALLVASLAVALGVAWLAPRPAGRQADAIRAAGGPRLEAPS